MSQLDGVIKGLANKEAQKRREYYRLRDAMDKYYDKYGKLPELTPREEPKLGRQIFGDLLYNTYLYYTAKPDEGRNDNAESRSD